MVVSGARGSVRFTAVVAAMVLAIPLGLSAVLLTADAGGATVNDFPVPGLPQSITTGPDGALWFTNLGTVADDEEGSISRMTAAGVVTTYTDPTLSQPSGITTGPDGALWFANGFGDSIGRITTNGKITNFKDPKISSPGALIAGPDGALWFTEYGVIDGLPITNRGAIGRITTDGKVAQYRDPSINFPTSITVGSDGALWFANHGATFYGDYGSIGRITTTGVVTSFADPHVQYPVGVSAGSDGALWFINAGTEADAVSGSIGRITTAGIVTTYSDPSYRYPGDIVAGPDGAMWFLSGDGSRTFSIGRIATGGTVTLTKLALDRSPASMTSGPDGALWFLDGGGSTGNAIHRITTSLTASAPLMPGALPGNGQAIVRWKVPTGIGASPTITYRVTPYLGDVAQPPQVFKAPATTGVLAHLRNGTSYRFRIAAQNAQGTGGWSQFTNAVTVGTPLAPTGVTAKKTASASLQVSFAIPAGNGARITSYTATCKGVHFVFSRTRVAKSGPITVARLRAGDRYICTVAATNSRGTGATSLPSPPVKF